ncbi:hypothetical protein QQP08_017445 [Theobroma cacao]|nr:hypothetical protein QQP08_017445 [Theobroma cacao]
MESNINDGPHGPGWLAGLVKVGLGKTSLSRRSSPVYILPINTRYTPAKGLKTATNVLIVNILTIYTCIFQHVTVDHRIHEHPKTVTIYTILRLPMTHGSYAQNLFSGNPRAGRVHRQVMEGTRKSIIAYMHHGQIIISSPIIKLSLPNQIKSSKTRISGKLAPYVKSYQPNTYSSISNGKQLAFFLLALCFVSSSQANLKEVAFSQSPQALTKRFSTRTNWLICSKYIGRGETARGDAINDGNCIKFRRTPFSNGWLNKPTDKLGSSGFNSGSLSVTLGGQDLSP